MKATEILKDQHDEVKALFKEAEDAEEAGERTRLVDEIIQSLQLHTKLEEEIVYPAIRELGTKKAQELIDEAFEDTTSSTSSSTRCPRAWTWRTSASAPRSRS